MTVNGANFYECMKRVYGRKDRSLLLALRAALASVLAIGITEGMHANLSGGLSLSDHGS